MTKNCSTTDVIPDEVSPADQPALKKLSKSLVQQAAKVTVQEAKDEAGAEGIQQEEGLEAWHPEQVYQKAINWVGAEMQEHLLDGFLDTSNESSSTIDVHKFMDYLLARGLNPLQDPRLKDFLGSVRTKGDSRYVNRQIKQHIPREEFKSLILRNPLLLSAIKGEFVIEDFQELVQDIDEIFEKCKAEEGGAVTTYIPSLATYPPEKWGVAVCTIDGQTHTWGDAQDYATMQSVSKPIFYGLCLDEQGKDAVHKMVGKEPSGHGYDKIGLGRTNIPHNPVINTGAITLASIYKQNLTMSARFESAMSKFRALTAGDRDPISFNNAVYLSERDNGHRNYAIGHYLKSKGCLEENVNLTDTLELYFQMCSIEASTQSLATMAATLANGGENMFTGEQVITAPSVHNMLSIMYSCGMYDYSGEWAFEIGLPAKSGISGFVIMVIPDVMGIAVWSPKLDTYGNSVRGVKFAQELVSRYSANKRHSTFHPLNRKRHALDDCAIPTTLSHLVSPQRGLCSVSRSQMVAPGNMPKYGQFTSKAAKYGLECLRYLKR